MMRMVVVVMVLVAVLVGVAVYFRGLFVGTVLADGGTAVKTAALSRVVKDIDGKDFDLSQLKGKVVLVVNVASKCGFTKQYAGLEKLYREHREAGLVIVGFPANDFGSQEPGSDEEIKQFCSSKYDVTFPMMSKVVVTGAGKTQVYKDLTENTGPFAGEVKWNFTKFLIARDGETVLGRFASAVGPEDEKLVSAVGGALGR